MVSKTLKYVIVVLACLHILGYCMKVSKADSDIIVMAYTLHTSSGYNNVTPGVIGRYFLDNPHSYAFGGVYYNSEKKVSLAAGFGIQGKENKYITPAMNFGLATGYGSAPSVIAMPSFVLKNNLVINILIDPSNIKDKTAINFGYKF